MYSNSEMNRQLKVIAKMCGIERRIVFHAGRDAAETLYKVQDSDIYHFYTTSVSTEKQVDRLLRDNLDGAGRHLNGMQSERIAVDWNKFM